VLMTNAQSKGQRRASHKRPREAQEQRNVTYHTVAGKRDSCVNQRVIPWGLGQKHGESLGNTFRGRKDTNQRGRQRLADIGKPDKHKEESTRFAQKGGKAGVAVPCCGGSTPRINVAEHIPCIATLSALGGSAIEAQHRWWSSILE